MAAASGTSAVATKICVGSWPRRLAGSVERWRTRLCALTREPGGANGGVDDVHAEAP
ncbi:MAG: hypothetical protein ACNA8W_23265 [Bradymonadaceae bacterium]